MIRQRQVMKTDTSSVFKTLPSLGSVEEKGATRVACEIRALPWFDRYLGLGCPAASASANPFLLLSIFSLIISFSLLSRTMQDLNLL